MINISIKNRLIIIFILVAIGAIGTVTEGQLGLVIGFTGIFGLIIMVIYSIIIARQEIAEIRKREERSQELS